MRSSICRLFSAVIVLGLLSSFARAEPDDEARTYPLILVHHPARISTMKQFDQNYFSMYRALSRELQALSPLRAAAVRLVATALTLPLSHEEGHRSILTTKRIGSISRPYADFNGAAYVEGVSDRTLQTLRDTDLPSYIRLHSAGLESDYALGNRCAARSAFNTESLKTIYIECAMRRFSHVLYFASAALPFLSPELDEEENELDRDIVGHDVWGAIRHLHRPDMPFFRYTNHSDLTEQEKSFATRTAVRALANLISPSLIGRDNWQVRPGTRVAAGLGYSLAPFGDFLDQNVWLKHGSNVRVHLYTRLFQNKHHWFPAAGAALSDYPLTNKLRVDASVHLWRQPKDLQFETSQGRSGGLVSLLAKYQVLGQRSRRTSVSIDLGVTAKTEGFVPEESYLTKKIGLQAGTTIRY